MCNASYLKSQSGIHVIEILLIEGYRDVSLGLQR